VPLAIAIFTASGPPSIVKITFWLKVLVAPLLIFKTYPPTGGAGGLEVVDPPPPPPPKPFMPFCRLSPPPPSPPKLVPTSTAPPPP
jgi:hypothetical protein